LQAVQPEQAPELPLLQPQWEFETQPQPEAFPQLSQGEAGLLQPPQGGVGLQPQPLQGAGGQGPV